MASRTPMKGAAAGVKRERVVHVVDEKDTSPAAAVGAVAGVEATQNQLSVSPSAPQSQSHPKRVREGSGSRSSASGAASVGSATQNHSGSLASLGERDRAVMDQTIFYPHSITQRHSVTANRASMSAGSAVAAAPVQQVTPPSPDTAGLSIAPLVPIPPMKPPLELTVNWPSFHTGRSGTQFGWEHLLQETIPQEDDDEELGRGGRGRRASSASTSHRVLLPDDIALSFIRCKRDFFRTGAKFSRRHTPLPHSDDAALSSSFGGSSDGGNTAAGLGHLPPSPPPSLPAEHNSLKSKVKEVEEELARMRELKRKGSSAEIYNDLTSSIRLQDPPVATSRRSAPPSSGDGGVTSRRNTRTTMELIMASSSAPRRSMATSVSTLTDEYYDDAADTIPDNRLVDRFTECSLEALTAVSIKLTQMMHVKFANVQLLNFAGCNIGDDGCLVVLLAIRFGSLKHVQCLDLMHNQLTVTSAFYMGILLLLRPPVSMIQERTNNDLRESHGDAAHQDAKQRALQLIAQRRAAQRLGGIGASGNRQGTSMFFYPLFESTKQVTQFFFGNTSGGSRARLTATSDGNGPSQGGMSRMSSLKNVVSAVMTLGALRHGGGGSSTNQRSLTPSASRSDAFGSSVSKVFTVDEDEFLHDEDSGDDDDDDSENDSDDEHDQLAEHLSELESVLGPLRDNKRRSTTTASIPPASGPPLPGPSTAHRNAGKQLPFAVQQQVKELQAQDLSNAATQIVSLRLCWNDLGDDGLTMLSEWLACQSFLLELSVGYNDITEVGFVALRDAMRSTTSLVSINTDGNQMDDLTAEALRSTLLYNRRVSHKTPHPLFSV